MRYVLLLLLSSCLGAIAAKAQSDATITLMGDRQEVLVDQSDANSGSVSVEQIGVGNVTQVHQRDDDNEADIVIEGSDQRHEVDQAGGGSNRLLLRSYGANSESRIIQQSAVGGLNAISLLQDGTNNQAMLEQQSTAAGLNSINLIQSGNDNLARLTQIGIDNAIDLTQNGNANSADITQTGNGLGFALTQAGGAQIVVTQSNPGG